MSTVTASRRCPVTFRHDDHAVRAITIAIGSDGVGDTNRRVWLSICSTLFLSDSGFVQRTCPQNRGRFSFDRSGECLHERLVGQSHQLAFQADVLRGVLHLPLPPCALALVRSEIPATLPTRRPPLQSFATDASMLRHQPACPSESDGWLVWDCIHSWPVSSGHILADTAAGHRTPQRRTWGLGLHHTRSTAPFYQQSELLQTSR